MATVTDDGATINAGTGVCTVREKKQTQEKVAKSEKKISDLEELFSSLKKEKKKTKPKKKKELLTHSNYEYLEPEKEIKKEESVIEVEISEDDDTDDIIKQTTKKLSEMKVANELEKEKKIFRL